MVLLIIYARLKMFFSLCQIYRQAYPRAWEENWNSEGGTRSQKKNQSFLGGSIALLHVRSLFAGNVGAFARHDRGDDRYGQYEDDHHEWDVNGDRIVVSDQHLHPDKTE